MRSADIDVTPNTTLYVEVGGNGDDATGGDVAGGWNGGGAGKASGGAGGGGPSDVRTISAAGAGTLTSRLLVAGGGGGAAHGGQGGSSDSSGGTPDSECIAPGEPGNSGNSGGAGGAGWDSSFPAGEDGSSGSGGDGGAGPSTAQSGAGGGGGYVGGGGGGVGSDCSGGGGGGSSFLTPGGTPTGPGTDFGNRTWITISYVVPMKPLVTTTPASDITQTSATPNGVLTPETVTPPDSGALCQFDYGLDSNYGTATPLTPCGTGMDQVYFSDTVSNLTPGTTYFFRLVASNRYGYSYDLVNGRSFTTLAPPPAPAPTATTSPATNVGQHGATLNGVVNPRGTATSYHFDYGKTRSYGKHTSTQPAGAGTTNVNVQAALSALLRHTTYHFRVVAVSTQGTTVGGDRTFRTG